MGDSTPQHPGYVKMEDTPWITQGREIADIGGKGVLDNYGKVNVFDEGTKASLNARNNNIYNRAFGDMERAYTDTMNKYNAANYNQFGTLNATQPAYRTDEYQRQFQRQLDDLAYNKAVNYENLINKELQRRYNTLDMFGNMYQYGVTPHNVDIANWNTANTNKDIAYANALSRDLQGGGWQGALQGAAQGASAGSAFGPWGTAIGGIVGGIGGYM
jgi:hypothetical protein